MNILGPFSRITFEAPHSGITRRMESGVCMMRREIRYLPALS